MNDNLTIATLIVILVSIAYVIYNMDFIKNFLSSSSSASGSE